jgi:hypothetical protein
MQLHSFSGRNFPPLAASRIGTSQFAKPPAANSKTDENGPRHRFHLDTALISGRSEFKFLTLKRW